MSRPIIKELNTIFIHVPKTGGVSIDQFFREKHGLEEFTGHHSAAALRSEYPEYFSQFFKFAFVRNPWDRLVSAFYFLDQGGYSKIDRIIREKHLVKYNGDFTKFILDLPKNLDFVKGAPALQEKLVDGLPFETAHFVEQSYWICNNQDEILVDFVGRFERLAEDFRKVCIILGIDYSPLTKRNASQHDGYQKHYNDETRRIVAELFERDIRLFGYSF